MLKLCGAKAELLPNTINEYEILDNILAKYVLSTEWPHEFYVGFVFATHVFMRVKRYQSIRPPSKGLTDQAQNTNDMNAKFIP